MKPPQVAVEILGGNAPEASQEVLDLAVARVDRLNVHGAAHTLTGAAVDGLVRDVERRRDRRIAPVGVGDEQGVPGDNRLQSLRHALGVEDRQGAAEGLAGAVGSDQDRHLLAREAAFVGFAAAPARLAVQLPLPLPALEHEGLVGLDDPAKAVRRLTNRLQEAVAPAKRRTRRNPAALGRLDNRLPFGQGLAEGQPALLVVQAGQRCAGEGIFDLSPRAKQFEAQFADVETAYGAPFPLRARQEIERLKERLSLVERQIAEVEAERDEVARSGAKLSVADALEGSSQQAAAKIATLTQLKGIGENDATLLTHEVFYRGFRNRRELAGWVGITPTPWASGNTERDQGVGRDGPAWIRANLIQMAWRWLRHQPDSALSEWFRGRTAGARGRIRRVMIVALARKLLIALWRFSETGLVPSGVRLA